MSFDLEKFKAGQPALTRSGEKRWFVHLDMSLKPSQQLITKDERGSLWTYHISGAFSYGSSSPGDLIAMYEKPPEPRQIDWSKIAGSSVPVHVRDHGHEKWDQGFLKNFYRDTRYPFRTNVGYKQASLETGLWVFNASGKNPWPEGVIVEVTLRNGTVHNKTADPWRWNDTKTARDIIASRAVGLEEGWTY